MRTKCIFGEALRIWVKKLKHNLRENYSKSTKIAITACKFSKFFRGGMPPDPLKLFLFLNQLQIISAEKIPWKFMFLPLLKYLATPLPALVVGEENLVISFAPPPTLEMLPPSLLKIRVDFLTACVQRLQRGLSTGKQSCATRSPT